MRSRWRAIGAAAAVTVASLVFLAAMVEFLAPDLAYAVKDRTAELLSGDANRRFRIGLGSTAGSGYLVATVLNRRLAADAGYELEIASNPPPGAASALLDRDEPVDLAIVDSASDAVIETGGVGGLAALETQFFSVIVPNDSPVQDVRDLEGAVNTGTRTAGRPPTLGDRVLDYYGLVAPGRVSVVRPTGAGNVEDFEAGHNTASTRTQSLHSELVQDILRSGNYRLVPIADHEALATFLPGTRAGFIPPGLYGQERRIPAEPVPTITVTQLLVARADVPGRVVRDVLEALYDPSFAREVRYALDERSGSELAGLPLHPAAEIYYHGNDPVTSDRLDAEGIQSLRSVHRICWLAMEQRRGGTVWRAPATHPERPATPHEPAAGAATVDPPL